MISEESEKPIGLIDLDGTLADFDGSMRAWMKTIASPEEGDISHLLLRQDDEPEYIKERRRLIKKMPGFWRNLPPLDAGREILNAMTLTGYENYVLTNGPKKLPTAWMEKVEWCAANVPELPMFVGRNKALVYGRVLADDWPKYIIPWLERRPRGLVIMPAQPWNADFKHASVVRYDGKNYDEVVERLAKAAKQ